MSIRGDAYNADQAVVKTTAPTEVMRATTKPVPTY